MKPATLQLFQLSQGMKWSDQKHANYHNLQWVREDGFIEACANVCGTGEAFLELGCGTGVMISRLAREFNRCVGVDPAQNLLAVAPRLPNIEYVPLPLEEIQYEREFDCVLLRNTVHHLKDPEAGISTAMRALRRGGRIVLVEGVPPDSRVRPFYTELFSLFDKRHILTEGDLLALLRVNGFENVVLQPYFMENVKLLDWLKKVSPNEEVRTKALKLHLDGDEHFRRVYDFKENNGDYTMTWRFMVASGVRP
jgi:SAM-dependent methyltransferase